MTTTGNTEGREISPNHIVSGSDPESLYQRSEMKVGYRAFHAESGSSPSQTKQPLTFFQLIGVWEVLSDKLVGFNHVLVDQHMSALKPFSLYIKIMGRKSCDSSLRIGSLHL